MFAKIVKGKDLPELEERVNEFICENWQPKPDTLDHEYNDKNETVEKRLKFYNVQQFVIGEVDPKAVSILNQQPIPKFSFCLLLICGYE